ncbi:MAG TPA: hypothetical protein VJ875_25255 [Pyrinomonadaceae bacterium]|nr:hypothetical protein [Pyrinomonadaceae bacterium]
MYSLLISIILVLGGAQSPSGDFNDSNATSDTVATSQATTTTSTPVQHNKKA